MQTFEVTKRELKNYLIDRSLLNKKASSVLEALNYLSCIQVDPINVVARSHELALYNRVENFKLADLEKELYQNHSLFEYWLQLFAIIPSSAYPYLKHTMLKKRNWHDEFYKKHKVEIEQVYEFIKVTGPSSSKEIMHIPKISAVFSWGDTESRTAALTYLWDRGRILICSRTKNRKYYDLTERVIPEAYLNQNPPAVPPTENEFVEWVIKSNFNYLGIVRKSFLTKFNYSRYFPVRETFKEKVKNGEIVQLVITDANIKNIYFILAEQVEQLKKLNKQSIAKNKMNFADASANLHSKLNILPPLDPLVIDRPILEDIFNFYYRWEAYVPKTKRTFGFYGMPILYKGEFVGQIELGKAGHKLRILNLQTKVKSKEFKLALKTEIRNLENLLKLST